MSEEKAGQGPAEEDKANQAEGDQGQDVTTDSASEEETQTSPRKRTIIFAVGLFLLVVGFLVLHQANPAADNWAGKTSPVVGLVYRYCSLLTGFFRLERI